MNLEFILADRSLRLEQEFGSYRDTIYYQVLHDRAEWSLGVVQVTWTVTEAQCSACSLCVIKMYPILESQMLFFLLRFWYDHASQNSNLQNVEVPGMRVLRILCLTLGSVSNEIYDKYCHFPTPQFSSFAFL